MLSTYWQLCVLSYSLYIVILLLEFSFPFVHPYFWHSAFRSFVRPHIYTHLHRTWVTRRARRTKSKGPKSLHLEVSFFYVLLAKRARGLPLFSATRLSRIDVSHWVVIKSKKVEIAKEVKRSDSLWRFTCGDVFLTTSLPRIPNSSYYYCCSSQKPSPGDISGTKRDIIDPLVSKRPGTNSE